MKLNNKGFMMAELIVVSSIVLVTIAGMYTSYNKIFSIYKSRIGYYDVNTLYRLGYYRDIMVEDESIIAITNQAKTAKIVNVTNGILKEEGVQEKVFVIYNKKTSINGEIFQGIKDINPTFVDYADYLSETIENFNKYNYMMIIERCENNSVDNCAYAYLEIFDSMLK